MKLKQLKKLGLPGKSHVTLSYSDGQDVFHYTDDDHEGKTVIETGVAKELATLITQKAISNNNLIVQMRSWNLLEDYERGTFSFKEYVTDVISQNWRDCGLLDVLTEHYDHKRGFSRVTAEVKTTVEKVLNLDESVLSGWKLKVQLDAGSLEIE